MQTAWTSTVVMAPPVGRGLRSLGWLGTASAAMLVLWLVAGRAVLELAAGRPPLVLVGSELLGATVELGGYAEVAFRLGLAVLWVAAPLAVATRGYRYATALGRVAVLAVGLLGLGAAAPVVAAMAVLAANVALWGMAVVLGAVLFLLLLLRILTAPFRR